MEAPARAECTDKKNRLKLKIFNDYLLMGWSESHISLKYQRYMTFTPSHQQIFIEFPILTDFFLTVRGAIKEATAPPPPRLSRLLNAGIYRRVVLFVQSILL